MTNYLVTRNGTYYFRRKIPLDLQQHYPSGSGNRKEIVSSLRTTDRAIASVLCRVEAVRVDEEFEKLRGTTDSEKAKVASRVSWDAALRDACQVQIDEMERARIEHDEAWEREFGDSLSDEAEAAEYDRVQRQKALEGQENERQILVAMEAMRRMRRRSKLLRPEPER